MFRSAFTMNDPCPECGLIFQREEGYFLGAMYTSYILSAAIVVPAYLLISTWRPHLAGISLAFGVFVLYLPLVPLVWRYSRVMWIFFERAVCPGDVSATAYEKYRQQQLEKSQPTPAAHEQASQAGPSIGCQPTTNPAETQARKRV
jgi:hypothetical protein